MSRKKIELLAPVGSIESFHAALDAGADAVYLGFGDFNARMRSQNFKAETLAYLIPYAQSLGKKVYITMNTLIKDGEMPIFINSVNIIKQLKPDAIIVQDLGMAALLREYFPNIELHGSTQMAIHNSVGFEAAKKLGITRVVPARELTLQEIRKINNKAELEIELFVHGALCYSVSGNCLASSFLGGSSGNRGRCTQVCRRKFTEGRKSGFYFSPKDFWAIDYLDEYRNIGITSLKIEGRMRSSDYVFGVTSAYRRYLDGEISLDDAKEALTKDFGRDKCSFLLGGEQSTGIVSAAKAGGTGIFAGTVEAATGDDILLSRKGETPLPGDRLRCQPKNGEEGVVVKVESVNDEAGMRRLKVSGDVKLEEEGAVYIISRADSHQKEWRTRRVDLKPRKLEKKKGIPAGKMLASVDRKVFPSKNRNLFIRVDSEEWLTIVSRSRGNSLILSLNEKMAEEIDFTQGKLKRLAPSIILALPPFLSEIKMGFWKKQIARLKKQGIKNWMIPQFGEKELFTKSDNLYADYTVWSINRYTQKMLLENGFKAFSYSPEDDILNLKRTGSDKGLFPVFMRVPLFLSRVKSVVQDGREVKDSRNEKFLSIKRDDLSNLISEQALGLTHRVDKLMGYGIENFIVDFSWYEPSQALYNEVIFGYEKKKRIEGSSLFNHKGGLK
jgi:putative protease